LIAGLFRTIATIMAGRGAKRADAPFSTTLQITIYLVGAANRETLTA
jgi:hypothetical protein